MALAYLGEMADQTTQPVLPWEKSQRPLEIRDKEDVGFYVCEG